MPSKDRSLPASDRLCATRALKNAHHLQKVAPELMPAVEPPEGFGSVIPIKTLARLHMAGAPELRNDANLQKALKGVTFPKIMASGSALFQGTLYFVSLQFTIQNQHNAVISVSAADVATAIQYSENACPPISAYAGQYGSNSCKVSPTATSLAVTLPSASYNDAQLQGWVNTAAASLPADACVVILNPQSMDNTSGSRSAGIGGYHGQANVPYIFVNLFGSGLTVADTAFAYAQILSHEIAEMVVDPRADNSNPEVCDPCGPNCQSVYLDYFRNGAYVGTTQTFPPTFAFDFYINGIVKPEAATQCPAPAADCDYGPPLVRIPIGPRAHVHDAAWIIELWLLIHGGDPPPEGPTWGLAGELSTLRAINALARCLGDAKTERAVTAASKEYMQKLGEQVTRQI